MSLVEGHLVLVANINVGIQALQDGGCDDAIERHEDGCHVVRDKENNNQWTNW
jgi:hypothetical protein